MRVDSGGGKGSNNTCNPTLKDHEREKGVSRNAISGGKTLGGEKSRTSARKHQNS